MPAVNGRIDHLSADVKGQRLFVAALGNRTVEVLDVQSARRIRTLTSLAEPQGLYYVPTTNRLFAACAGNGTVVVFDAATFQQVATVKFSSDAAAKRWLSARGRAFSCGNGQSCSLLLTSAASSMHIFSFTRSSKRFPMLARRTIS